MTSKVVPAPDGGSSVFYGYDTAGRVITTNLGSTSGSSLNFAYDTAGRLSQEITFGHVVTSTYDTAGNRIQLTWPDGFFVNYDYDAANRLIKVRENGVTTGTGVLATYAYGPLDERASLTRGNGTAASYTYDPIARLTGLTQGAAAGSPASIQALGYSPASQLVALNQATNAYVWTGQPAAASTATVADGLNRDQTIASLAGSFDANGNLTFDGTRHFHYDTQNRMTQALAGSTETDLSYDANDRVNQTVTGPAGNGTITRMLYDGDRLILEWDAVSGNTLRRYVHGVGTDEPLVWYEGATASDATRRYLHADHQGSIIAWSDSTGSTTGNTYTYGPYGEPQSWSGSRFRYTGQLAFSDAQIYHYKARAYDPIMGRFLQTDPIGQADDPNLYEYVRDDPTDDVDPTGECQVGSLAVAAHGGTGNSVVIVCSNGMNEVREGGTRAWRNNNPGNEILTKTTKADGAIGWAGTTGGKYHFAVFADPSAGEKSFGGIISKYHSGDSITKTMQAYDKTRPTEYAKDIASAIGVKADTKIQDLKPNQIETMIRTIEKVEHWKEGTIHYTPANDGSGGGTFSVNKGGTGGCAAPTGSKVPSC